MHTAIITGLNVFFSILAACFIFKYEQMTMRKAAGCAPGFCGIIIVNAAGPAGPSAQHFTFTGTGPLLLAQIAYTFSGSFIKKFAQRHDPVMPSGYQFITGRLLLMLTGAASGGHTAFPSAPAAYINAAYMALISAAAYTLWGILLKYNPVSKVCIYGFMNPLSGVIISAAALGETGQALSVNALAALILVCAGIYIVNSAGLKNESSYTKGT